MDQIWIRQACSIPTRKRPPIVTLVANDPKVVRDELFGVAVGVQTGASLKDDAEESHPGIVVN